MKNSTKRIFSSTGCNFLMIILLILFLFPVYWMTISSFQRNGDIMHFPPNFWPYNFTMENYSVLLEDAKYMIYTKNSVIVSFATVFCCLVVSALAGYAFSRFQFPGNKIFISAILNIQIFPTTVIIISLFTFYSSLNLLNTYMGLVMADFVITLPFTIWFLKAFFDTIPISLDESAKIDGCGRFQIISKIILPLIRPGMTAVAIYAFLQAWDDFMFALVIMKDNDKKTLPLGIAQSFIGEFATNNAGMMAISVIASVPVVLLFIITQKQLIAGLTAGAVKG